MKASLETLGRVCGKNLVEKLGLISRKFCYGSANSSTVGNKENPRQTSEIETANLSQC